MPIIGGKRHRKSRKSSRKSGGNVFADAVATPMKGGRRHRRSSSKRKGKKGSKRH